VPFKELHSDFFCCSFCQHFKTCITIIAKQKRKWLIERIPLPLMMGSIIAFVCTVLMWESVPPESNIFGCK